MPNLSLPTMRAAAAATFLYVGAHAGAVECLLAATSPDARIVRRSGELIDSQSPLADRRCETLRVAIGSVRVYRLSEDRMRIETYDVSGGPVIPGSRAATQVGEDGRLAQLWNEIAVVLAGGQRLKTGSSRGDTDDYLAEVLPSGRLAQPSGDIVITLGSTDAAMVQSFELSLDGRVRHRQASPMQAIRLPAAVLAAGNTVAWKLVVNGRPVSGTFVVDTPQVLATNEAQLEATVAGDSDATLRNLQIAAGLAARGYRWDSRRWIEAALKR